MPDSRKADLTVGLALNMKALARVHYFYVRGVESASVLTDQQYRTHYKFIEELENILLKSGYLTPFEIKARHNTQRPEVLHDSAIVPPFPE